MRTVLLCVSAAVVGLTLSAADGLTLAADGRTDYEIVRPDAASGAIWEWTAFLATTLREMTGASFPVVAASSHTAAKPAVFVASPVDGRMRFEEYVVRTQGSDLVLSGHGERGPELAIRHFLTRICGCRWYDGWTRKIPLTPTLVVPALSVRRTPSFFYRRIFQGCGWGASPKWNPSRYPVPRLSANPIGRPGDIHTFSSFTEDWPKDRLDLLSMSPKGKRRPFKGAMGPNFCLTNPEGRARIKKTLRAFIEKDRQDAARASCEAPALYCLSQNDCQQYYCKCPTCSAFEAEHGASGLLLDFVNDVARDIAAEYPDLILVTDAYAFAEAPPKGGIMAEANVLVEVARTKQNYYSAAEEDVGEAFVGYLKGWSKVARQLGVWDYWVFYWDTFPAPYHNVPFIRRNLKWYHDLGVRLVRMESEQPNTASFRSLKEWLGNELMLDVEQDDGVLIREFMTDFYGAAAPEMRAFMDLLTERQKGQVGKVFAKEGVYDPSMKADVPRRKWLDADFYAQAEELFERAEGKVAAADEQVRINVRRERIPVDLSLLYVYDIVRPSVTREALAKRYLENREAQYRLRVDAAVLPTALAKVRDEVAKLTADGVQDGNPAVASAATPRVPEPRTVAALADGGQRLDFDLTSLVVQPKEKGVQVTWTCREPNMSNIHARYDRGDWNVFSGDAVDFYFSPYLADATRGLTPSQYRFLMNPAGTSFTAYDDASWKNRSIVARRTFVSDAWQSDWFLPYAALASYEARKPDKQLLPTTHWLFEVARPRATTGERELLKGGQLRVEVPAKFLEPYARVALDRCQAVTNGTAEAVSVTARVTEMSGRPFAGRAKAVLYVGKERRTVGERAVSLAAGGAQDLKFDLTLPTSAERFAVAVAVADENSRCVRMSRDMPVANPWVE